MTTGTFFKLKQFLVKISLVFMAVELSSCSNDSFPDLEIETVSIYADPDANQNSAIAVDLVLVYNQELAKTIGKLTAAKYFAMSKQLLLDNPTLLDIWHWELVPGQIVEDFEPPQDNGEAFAGYVFANYLSPGEHRIKIGADGVVKVLLLKNQLKNLAMLNAYNVKTGTTMSDVKPEVESSGSPECLIKRGPTKNPAHPCQKKGKVASSTSRVPCSKPKGSQKAPISIRPLPPPSEAPCTPTNRKVKTWKR